MDDGVDVTVGGPKQIPALGENSSIEFGRDRRFSIRVFRRSSCVGGKSQISYRLIRYVHWKFNSLAVVFQVVCDIALHFHLLSNLFKFYDFDFCVASIINLV